MQRSVFTFPLAAAAIAITSLLQPAAVRADDVTLTSGSIVLNCPELPVLGNARIDLAGPDFSLIFIYFARPDPNCAGAEQRLLPARYDAVAFATFQGIRTQEMTGFLSFDEMTLTGFVEGRDLHNPQNILFTVNFSGSGAGVITITHSTFEVCPVPEPATLILLGIGSALFGGARQWRKTRKRRDSDAELQGE